MGEIRDFTDLIVWQRAIAFGKKVYEATQAFPRDERFGLTAQLRRAAVSVASNIAEGHARQGREYVHFLSIAKGSTAECESQLLFAASIGYLTAEEVEAERQLAREVHRMLAAILAKLRPSQD